MKAAGVFLLSFSPIWGELWLRAFLLAPSCVSLEDGMTQVNCCLCFSVQTALFFGVLLGFCSFLMVLQTSSRTVFIYRYLLSHVEEVELGEKDWVLLIYHLSYITPVNSLYFSEISPFCLCSGLQIFFLFVICIWFCLTFTICYKLFSFYDFWSLSWLERHSQLQSYKKDFPMFSFITSMYSNFALYLWSIWSLSFVTQYEIWI